MEYNLNVYQKAIESLVLSGHTVIELFPLGDNNALYYLVHKFNPAMRTPTDDIQYNQLVGINVTDFIRNNALADNRQFINALNLYLESASVVRMEFPNHVRWLKFAPAE